MGLTYKGQAWWIKDRSIKNNPTEGQWQKTMERAEQRVEDRWSNMYEIEASEGWEKMRQKQYMKR